MQTKKLHCTSCNKTVNATIKKETEIYPDRKAYLAKREPRDYWACVCGSHVRVDKEKVHVRYVLTTGKFSAIKNNIHSLIDPIWKSKKMTRPEVYRYMSKITKTKDFHVSLISCMKDAEKALKEAETLNGLYFNR